MISMHSYASPSEEPVPGIQEGPHCNVLCQFRLFCILESQFAYLCAVNATLPTETPPRMFGNVPSNRLTATSYRSPVLSNRLTVTLIRLTTNSNVL